MNEHPLVTLKDDWIDYCHAVACIRRGTAYLNGLEHRNGWTPTFAEALRKDFNAVCCELAAKIWLNPASKSGKVSWDRFGVGTADLAGFIDVKGVEHDYDCLIVRKPCRNDWAYLLVNSAAHPVYEIVGWMWGWGAKRDEWWKEKVPGRAAYFIEPAILDSNPAWSPRALFEEVKLREEMGRLGRVAEAPARPIGGWTARPWE